MHGINALTVPDFCPHSKQPELKHCAVQVEKVSLPWRLTAMAWLPAEQALRVREQIKPHLSAFGWACLLPFGREPDAQGRAGLLLRAGATRMVSTPVLEVIRQALGIDGTAVLTYHDLHRQQQRALRIERDASGREALQAFWLAGDASGEQWLRTLLEADEPLAVPGRQLLAPTHRMRQTAAPRSPQVCTCFNVTEQSIREALTQCSGSIDARVQHLQQTLRCGTNCGSCLPTLRTLAKAVEPSAIQAA